MGKKHIMGPRVTKRRVRAALERLGGWMFGYGAPALWWRRPIIYLDGLLDDTRLAVIEQLLDQQGLVIKELLVGPYPERSTALLGLKDA